MIQELATFIMAAGIFCPIMYLWFNFQEARGEKVNKKLKSNIEDWDEERMNIIGQNGNDGIHYTGMDTTDGTKIVTYEQKLGDSE